MRRSVKLCISLSAFAAFAVWTVLLLLVDVQAIGPNGSSVGFTALNESFHRLTGVNMTLYTVTDWLGLVPLGIAFGFAILGLVQLVKRRSLFKVDRDVFVLGGFYLAVVAVFMFFETVVINYRPVLIDGVLETSYPSSTTLLVMCVMPTAIMQFNSRVKNKILKKCLSLLIALFIIFMVVGRLISGVHWFADIVGGALLSAGLVMMYRYFARRKEE